MKLIESEFGLEINTGKFHGFFGNNKINLDGLKGRFKNYDFLRIKQIHSATVVEASYHLIEADAHFCDTEKKALVIATADCVPILIANMNSGLVAAVHAGWKGVATKILPVTLLEFITRGSRIEDCLFFFGPHIMQRSFEVEADVRDQLEAGFDNPKLFEKFCDNKIRDGREKFYICMQSLLREQLIAMGARRENIIENNVDTKTNLSWHSYRRDQLESGRNISFITKVE